MAVPSVLYTTYSIYKDSPVIVSQDTVKKTLIAAGAVFTKILLGVGLFFASAFLITAAATNFSALGLVVIAGGISLTNHKLLLLINDVYLKVINQALDL